MGEAQIRESELAEVMNEWMRRYIDEPERFEREFRTVGAFLSDLEACEVPSYGRQSAAYVMQIRAELAAKAGG